MSTTARFHILATLRLDGHSTGGTGIQMLPMVCGAVGIEAESDKIDMLLKEVEGKDVNELITSGAP